MIGEMVATLPPPSGPAVRLAEQDDVWSATTTPPLIEYAGRRLDDEDEEAPIERPPACTARRLLTDTATVAVLALALVMPALSRTDGVANGASSSQSTLLVGAYLLSLACFAWWTHGRRRTIDALRWRSFRRPVWSGWWALGWVLTPVVALAIAIPIANATQSRLWLAALGAALAIARMVLLQALGTNMSRVVRGAKRWLWLWGIVAGVVDLMMIDIAISGVTSTVIDSDRLDILMAWILPLLVMNTIFVVSYTKRVERWILEWWDNRYGITDDELLTVLHSIEHSAAGPAAYSGRRLLPTGVFRVAVFGSYLAVAGAALWNGLNIWDAREELTLASDADAAIDNIGISAVAFVVAMLAVQVTQGLWSMVAAWNARRCTVSAPSALGMLLLFVVGPAILAVGFLVSDDPGTELAYAGVALLVNLVCWAASFSVIARTLEVLRRSSELIARWGVTVSMHWVLIFMFRPLEQLENDRTYATVAVVVSVIDATIFIAASFAAWRAMKHFDTATREYRQVRRASV
jgi:hypothetical protein